MANGKFNVNESESRFELEIEPGMAIIDYIKRGDTFNLTHTEVPEAQQGQGAAHDIVSKSLQYLKENNFKVTPSCSFVSAYIESHPEWKSIVA